MKWDKYRQLYVKEAVNSNLSTETIDLLLGYAKVLFDKKVPIIFDEEHFSLLVGYKNSYIERATSRPNNFYRYYEIPKKNGKKRLIAEPLPNLKNIQKWILNEILSKCKVSKYAKAYVTKHSITSNAKFHKNKKSVLTIDVKDFFPSIKTQDVEKIFLDIGYNNKLATTLSKLCCLRGSLPQGAPTSPYLSNLFMTTIDQKIGAFCSQKNINYSRYADDLTFSGNLYTSEIIRFVKYLFDAYELKINSDKTRTRRKHQRQEVTGVVVNQKLQAPKNVRRRFRQEVYYIKKYGFDSHVETLGINRKRYLEHLIGRGNFIVCINKLDNSAMNDLQYLKNLYNQRKFNDNYFDT